MISFEKTVHFGRGSRSERQLREGSPPLPGGIPRISQLMALAIHYDGLLRWGRQITDRVGKAGARLHDADQPHHESAAPGTRHPAATAIS
jgi:hypothetical protein